MALGKPIVQFEAKEGRFSAQNASLYANPRNAIPDFAAKILWLLDHAEERRKMGEFGRRRVEEELAWEYSVKHLLAAYQRAFDKRRQRGGRVNETVAGATKCAEQPEAARSANATGDAGPFPEMHSTCNR
jgi:hypothetical protein